MKTIVPKGILAGILLLVLHIPTQAAFNHTVQFINTNRDPHFSLVRTRPQYVWSQTGGNLSLSKPAGITDGGISFNSTFKITGPFTIEVECTRTTGRGSAGVRVRAPNGYLSVYYATEGRGTHKVYSSHCVNGACGSGGTLTGPAQAPFRLRREGNTVFGDFKLYGAWETQGAVSGLSNEVSIELFLEQEQGFADATAAIYDNLAISSEGYVESRPSTSGTSIVRAVQISWPSEIDVLYQVQWASRLGDTNVWFDISDGLKTGDGQILSVFDAGTTPPQKYYRILESR